MCERGNQVLRLIHRFQVDQSGSKLARRMTAVELKTWNTNGAWKTTILQCETVFLFFELT